MNKPIEISNNLSQEVVRGFGEFKANKPDDFNVNSVEIGVSEARELCPICKTLQTMKMYDLKKTNTEKIRSYYCSACCKFVRSENIRTVTQKIQEV